MQVCYVSVYVLPVICLNHTPVCCVRSFLLVKSEMRVVPSAGNVGANHVCIRVLITMFILLLELVTLSLDGTIARTRVRNAAYGSLLPTVITITCTPH